MCYINKRSCLNTISEQITPPLALTLYSKVKLYGLSCLTPTTSLQVTCCNREEIKTISTYAEAGGHLGDDDHSCSLATIRVFRMKHVVPVRGTFLRRLVFFFRIPKRAHTNTAGKVKNKRNRESEKRTLQCPAYVQNCIIGGFDTFHHCDNVAKISGRMKLRRTKR